MSLVALRFATDLIDYLFIRRARFFVSGTFTFLLTTTACYASFVYNVAVARSNAELVANAVIVLFLCDLDEQVSILTCSHLSRRTMIGTEHV